MIRESIYIDQSQLFEIRLQTKSITTHENK